jgi:hypothetical protein
MAKAYNKTNPESSIQSRFKSNDFGSVHCRGLTGAFFVSVHSRRLSWRRIETWLEGGDTPRCAQVSPQALEKKGVKGDYVGQRSVQVKGKKGDKGSGPDRIGASE